MKEEIKDYVWSFDKKNLFMLETKEDYEKRMHEENKSLFRKLISFK